MRTLSNNCTTSINRVNVQASAENTPVGSGSPGDDVGGTQELVHGHQVMAFA